MALTLRSVSGKLCRDLLKASRILHKQSEFLHISGARYLFSADVLGIESYKRHRADINEKIKGLKERYRSRMEDYMASSTKNTIFTDDLKTMIHITESQDDIDTTVKMIKRFQAQSNELRFSSFVFGPLVMRLLHILNKPDLAYDLFVDKDLSGFFDQMSSYTTLMDNLFENGQYERVLDVMDMVVSKQLGGFRYPVDCVTLSIASCLKMNTRESYEKMVSILKLCKEQATVVSLRTVIFATLLALKQGEQQVAYEILALKNDESKRMPLSYANVKVLVLTSLGRHDEAMNMLNAVVSQDLPDHFTRGGEIFADVITSLEAAIAESGNKELQLEFGRLHKELIEGNHISDTELETFAFGPIIRRRQLQDGYKQRTRSDVGGYRQQRERRPYRPGLRDRDDQVTL